MEAGSIASRRPDARTLGVAALVTGVLLLAAQTLGTRAWSFAWALYAIVPGPAWPA